MATTIEMDVSRYVPRHEKLWKDNGDGSFSAHLYTHVGLVEVFTFKGDARCAAFTSFEMFIAPHIYRASIPRHYHRRWLVRLANDFSHHCLQLSDSQS